MLLPKDGNSRAREKEAGLPPGLSTGQPRQVSKVDDQTISAGQGWGTEASNLQAPGLPRPLTGEGDKVI